MKKLMENKKTTFLLLGVVLIALVLVGTSYAWWTTTAHQTDTNIVQSGCLKLTLENEQDDISLQKAYPITDASGKKLKPYTFTVQNNCETAVDYTIALETLTETTLNSDYVKYELIEMSDVYILEMEIQGFKQSFSFPTNEECQQMLEQAKSIETMGGSITKKCEIESAETVSYLNKLSEEPDEESRVLGNAKEGKVLLQYTLNKKESKDYELRLWMDYDTPSSDDSMNQKFQSKIVLKGELASPGMLRKLDAFGQDTQGMWQYKDTITKIVIENQIHELTEENVIGPNDESRFQDGSVVSYLVKNEDGTYTAHLQGNGGIALNYDSSFLFNDFEKVTSIDGMENLDTSKVRNMMYMFYRMNYLENLDLKDKFDTSQVTDMSFMFSESYLTQLNLGDKFDTSQVTNMKHMFSNLSLTNLNLGEKFDTSRVTDMSQMFSVMLDLTQLDLGEKFDTRNVTNMTGMFIDMQQLIQLDLGDKFDTSNVVDMSGMFSGDSKLQTIEYGNKFIHNSKAGITSMFGGCQAPKPTKETHPSWDGVVFD